MDENQKQEYQALVELEGQNILDDSQVVRLAELRSLEQNAPGEDKVDRKDLDSALAQKEHWRVKAEKEAAERKKLEERLNRPDPVKGLEPEAVIEITNSLNGLDSRQQEYLLQQHKMSGKPLKELRQSEDFQFWDSAYTQKVEKEKQSLPPSSRQNDEEREVSLEDALLNAQTDAEREKILEDTLGYSVTSSPRPDKVIRR